MVRALKFLDGGLLLLKPDIDRFMNVFKSNFRSYSLKSKKKKTKFPYSRNYTTNNAISGILNKVQLSMNLLTVNR